MDATVETGELRQGLARAKRATAKSASSMLALRSVRLEPISRDRLRLTATDLNLLATVEIPAVVADPGGPATFLPVALTEKLMKGTGPVRVTGMPQRVVLENGARYELETIDTTDFPDVQVQVPTEGDGFAPVSGVLPRAVLEYVMAAVSKDAARPVLNGVCVRGQYLLATDSYRLTIVDMGEDVFPGADGGEMSSPVIPSSFIAQLLTTKASTFEFEIGGREVRCSVPAERPERWGATLIDAEFPDVRNIVNWDVLPMFRIERPGFEQALAKVKMLVSDDTTPVWVRAHDRGLQVSVNGPSIGKAEAIVAGEWLATASTGVALNPTYLAEMLSNTEATEFSSVDGSALKPVYLMDNVAGHRAAHLLMPVRTG